MSPPTLDEFDFAAASHIPAPLIHTLAEGSYLERAEPVLFIGDSGTVTGGRKMVLPQIW